MDHTGLPSVLPVDIPPILAAMMSCTRRIAMFTPASMFVSASVIAISIWPIAARRSSRLVDSIMKECDGDNAAGLVGLVGFDDLDGLDEPKMPDMNPVMLPITAVAGDIVADCPEGAFWASFLLLRRNSFTAFLRSAGGISTASIRKPIVCASSSSETLRTYFGERNCSPMPMRSPISPTISSGNDATSSGFRAMATRAGMCRRMIPSIRALEETLRVLSNSNGSASKTRSARNSCTFLTFSFMCTREGLERLCIGTMSTPEFWSLPAMPSHSSAASLPVIALRSIVRSSMLRTALCDVTPPRRR